MFEVIRQNKRRSSIIIAVMGAVLVCAGASVGAVAFQSEGGVLLGGAVALAMWIVLWMITLTKGDDILIAMARARPIQKSDHPQLVNVVEEMSIASGLGKPPRIYLVDDPAPNAFAAGRDPNKACVAVTTGLLKILDRDELQGVIAHEMAHIKNRDVALMTTAGIMLGSIVLLSEVGTRLLWFGGGSRRSRDGRDVGLSGPMVVLAILFMVLAPILAHAIYFSLSRRREYLADATGVLFTRYPNGLASALEKLSESHKPQADESRVTAPMYIVTPLRKRDLDGDSTAFFSTHPPVKKRIAILRAMSGDAGYREYESACRKVTGSGLIPAASLGGAAVVGLALPMVRDSSEKPRDRAREASDAFLHAAGYRKRACGLCGVVLKVPPSLSTRLEKCPRCHAKL